MRAEAAPSSVWVADLLGPGARIQLSPDESHYLAHVCRVHAGDVVTGTDGRGVRASLRVTSVAGTVEALVESMASETRTREAWILCGAPEAQRADWLVEKLAELGVSVFQPIDCRRSAWKAARDRGERWHRLAIAALRQSRRTFLLEVREPVPLAAGLAGVPEGARCWLADPIGLPASRIQPPREGVSAGLIGPAAGFEADEREEAKARGFQPMRLADGRLRTETAGLAWGAWWAAGMAEEGQNRPEFTGT